MKDVNAIYGIGAFRDKDFDELMKEKKIEPKFDEDKFWTEDPVEEKVEFDNKKDKSWGEIQVPKEDLSNIKEYSFSAYVKFSMADPFRQGLNIPRGAWRGILGITE